MNTQDMIDILNNAIQGKPNSCLSEHKDGLIKIRDILKGGYHYDGLPRQNMVPPRNFEPL